MDSAGRIFSNRYIRFLLSLFAVFLPPYLIELATEYLYFSHYVLLYFFFSSFRLYFFIIYFGIVSYLLGRKSTNLRITLISYSAGSSVLFALVYIAGCNPKVCYNTGIDGLEPLRVYSFFLAEGLASCNRRLFAQSQTIRNRNIDRKNLYILLGRILSRNFLNCWSKARHPNLTRAGSPSD